MQHFLDSNHFAPVLQVEMKPLPKAYSSTTLLTGILFATFKKQLCVASFSGLSFFY
jgi:hypothetical protein